MRQWFAVITLVLSLTGVLRPGAVCADVIVLAGSEWCPYSCGPDAVAPGYAVELATHILSAAGHAVQYQQLPWARALLRLESGTVHGVLGLSRSPERLARGFVYPQQPIGISENVFFVRADNPWRYTGLNSMETISVAVIHQNLYGPEFDAYVRAHLGNPQRIEELARIDALEFNLIKVSKGRVGATISDRFAALYEIRRMGLQGAFEEAGGLAPDPIYVAFSPQDPKAKDYAALLDEGIARMRADGSLAALLNRYGLPDWE